MRHSCAPTPAVPANMSGATEPRRACRVTRSRVGARLETDPASAQVEDALAVALAEFGRFPGASVRNDGDLVRIASGYPFFSFNHIVRSRLRGPTAERRIGGIVEGFGSAGLTWWVTPSTRPGDLARRLSIGGLREVEPEIGMILELPSGPSALPPAVREGLARAEAPPGGVDVVASPAQLAEWIDVMASSYAWPNLDKRDALIQLYGLPTGFADGKSTHFIVRSEGRPVACASLFTSGRCAWVTNVGAVPAQRGRGFGSAATALAVRAAASSGHPAATLAASLMGRRMYQRLGFREAGVLRRLILPDR